MKEQVAQTVGGILDAKTLAGGGVAGGGFMIHFMQISEAAGVFISALVGFATLVYVCQGIRNRYLEGKKLRSSVDPDKKGNNDFHR